MLVFVAIVKNEAPYLLEWIAYHRAVGVDHFVILDNDSSDATRFLLAPLAMAGVVSYFRWQNKLHYLNFGDLQIGPQTPAYQFGFRTVKKLDRWKWVGFIDLDEFVVPGSMTTIIEELETNNQGSDGVAINWKIFGSSGNVGMPPGLVVDNFTRRAPNDFPANVHVKSIVQTAALLEPGIHIPLQMRGKLVDVDGNTVDFEKNGLHQHVQNNYLTINHYFTKSKEEWLIKRNRGRVSKSLTDDERLRSDSAFEDYDRNEIVDQSILRFRPMIDEQLRELYALISQFSRDIIIPSPNGEI